MRGLYIFRRDLRWIDNTALHYACKECTEVICVFILNPAQIDPQINKYLSENAVAFMLETLIELQSKYPLTILYGDNNKVIDDIIRKCHINKIYLNRDYTPYAKRRDNDIINNITRIPVALYDDACLNNPDAIKPYKKFTPYYATAVAMPVDSIIRVNYNKIIDSGIKSVNMFDWSSRFKGVKLRQQGGRVNAEIYMKRLQTVIQNYDKRDFLNVDSSRLSPYIKFGVISIREVWHKANAIRHKNSEEFIRQLYWRDFYTQVMYHFPKVIGNNFRGTIVWTNNKTDFNKWCNGELGIPLIDAAMKELKYTGYMHNRCRMIVANYLTKVLKIDWRWGEHYFATHLTDYDPANNNGGWQWASGTGVDGYNRIFNPYLQAKKYDAHNKYINKWRNYRS